ncbi:hypothetical protein SAMN05443247_03826 [Bradyrhizobium erythrophlei]|nr:hypothetical protein SAMN05443247_03826 [Bradyrhizobium erythrophlei]
MRWLPTTRRNSAARIQGFAFTPAWKKHAADLEAEMLKRGMLFGVIEWHDGQEKLPFE